MQAIDTVVAGILHDVVDDTCESLYSIEQEFDTDVAKLVAGVSRLSYINQVQSDIEYSKPNFQSDDDLSQDKELDESGSHPCQWLPFNDAT